MLGLYRDFKLSDEVMHISDLDEAEKLQPSVDDLLKRNHLSPEQIDQLAICVGPGGFTSARIGVSAVNAWAFAKKILIAQVTVFDLYREEKSITFICANTSEAWVKFTDKDPIFLKIIHN